MKKNIIIISTILVQSALLIGCFEENDNIGSPDPNSFSKITQETVSPSKTKSAKIYETGNSNGKLTQVLVSFGWPQENGGGGVFAAEGTGLDINVNWKDDNSLFITYKEGLKLYPKIDTVIQLFKEKVKISYRVLSN